MIDYIVVGFGLAGLSLVEELENHNKSYLVYENYSEQSSRVAGGLYNPIILKRFTAAWLASEQLEFARPFYKRIEHKLKESLVSELPVLRRFNSIEEQNLWFEACDKPTLETFLSTELIRNNNPALDISFHYGRVKHTGRVDVKKMLSAYIRYMKKKRCVKKESFDHSELKINVDFVEYKGVKAKNIVFSEGFGIRNNPFFNYLPLPGNKGEYIIIKSKELRLKDVVKSSIFIIPLGNDLYKVGATYDNKDKTAAITELAREELQNKLERFLKADYTIVDQVGGIRPATRDRKPLVGSHPEYKKVHIINGLGSRGILIGPFVAKKMYDYLEKGTSLEKEINIKRFENLR